MDYQKQINKLTTPKLINFCEFLNRKNLTKKTIYIYLRILNKIEIENIDFQKIKNFITNPKINCNTQLSYKNAICEYLKFINNCEWVKELRFLKLKKQGIIYRPVLTANEVYQKTQVKIDDDLQTIKTKIITQFLFETGIRACELNNISFDNCEIYVKGKGNKKRQILFCDSTVESLLTHFLNLDLNVNYRSLIRNIKKLFGTKYACHTLRRSFATHMLINKANPKTVQLQMGHSKIETTFSYLNLSKNFNQSEYDKVFKKFR